MKNQAFIHEFIKVMATHRADSTVHRYERLLIRFSDRVEKSFKEVSVTEVMNFTSEAHLNPRTWVVRFAVLKHFFNWMQSEGFLLVNPMNKLTYPKVPKLLPKHVMTIKETKILLESIVWNSNNIIQCRDKVILELLYSCSLRRSEVVAIDIEDFDASTKSLRIKAGKTHRGRIVPVGQYVNDLIGKYIALDKGASKTNALFQNYRHHRLSADYITILVGKLRKKTGIRTKASSHSFRKSSATHMLKNGASLVTVQALLGHASICSTEIYTKVYPKDLFRIHRAHHPREKQKNILLPNLSVPTLLFRRK